jgi:hypothetical protein
MKVEVDERLLAFSPFYKKLWLRNNPNHRDVPDHIIQEALLKAMEQCGYAKRVRDSNGRVHLIATDAYLKFQSQSRE